MTEEKNNKYREIFASSHINFLFGAGVNGGAFKQLSNFIKTLEVLKDVSGIGLEEKLNNAEDNLKLTAINEFCNEFNEFYGTLDFEHESIKHIKELFFNVNKVIEKTENRNESMKKVNIFTLNYDSIIEEVLSELGYFNTCITVKRLETIAVFDIIGHNLETKRQVPTYCIAKLHGSINKGKITSEDIIYPGLSKYSKTLDADFFQVLFKMKSELMRFNSLLIVIGYSGFDEHINRLIRESINNGLTVLWFKFNKDDSDENIVSISNKIIIIEPTKDKNKQDTTLTCATLITEEVL